MRTDPMRTILQLAFSPQQHEAIARLAAGQSVTATARELNIHRTTIHHWTRTDPDFAQAVRDAKQDRAEEWKAAADPLAADAFTFIGKLINNESATISQRLKASLFVLGLATKAPAPPTKDQLDRERLQRAMLQVAAENAAAADSSEFITSEENSQPVEPTTHSSAFITPDQNAATVEPSPTTDSSHFITPGENASTNESTAATRTPVSSRFITVEANAATTASTPADSSHSITPDQAARTDEPATPSSQFITPAENPQSVEPAAPSSQFITVEENARPVDPAAPTPTHPSPSITAEQTPASAAPAVPDSSPFITSSPNHQPAEDAILAEAHRLLRANPTLSNEELLLQAHQNLHLPLPAQLHPPKLPEAA